VDLCRQCAGNRWLPEIELAAGPEGGGSVVFLEFAAPVDYPVHGQFAGQWRARAGDAEFQEVRQAARIIDAEHGNRRPGGQVRPRRRPHLPSHRRAAGANRRLLPGWTELYGAILEDVAEVPRRIPRERIRYQMSP